MKFTSPSGRTYTWDKPEPPTQEDIDALVAYDASLGGAEQSPLGPAPVQPVSTVTGMTATQARQRGEAGMAGLKEGLASTPAMAARYGIPIGAAVATGGMSLPLQAAIGFGAGALGEAAALGLEGKSLATPESAGEVAKSAVLSSTVVRPAAKVLESAAVMGGFSALAEATGNLVAGREISQNVLQSTAVPAVAGAGIGMLGRLGAKYSDVAQRNAERRQWFSEVGIKQPTAGMLEPDLANLERVVARDNPELANRRNSTESFIMSDFYDRLGAIPSNQVMADSFGNIVGRMDEASAAMKQANQAYADAQAKAVAAREAAQVDPVAAQELFEQAAVEKLNANRQRAAAAVFAAKVAGPKVSLTAYADELTSGLLQLDDTVSTVSRGLYGKTGLKETEEIVSREDLLRSAKATLGGQSSSTAGKRILDAIENLGKTEGDEAAPEMLSWVQFQDLRDEMSRRFGNENDKYLNRAEALASRVYTNLGDVFREAIGTAKGTEAATAYDAAKDFWMNWSQLRDSNFGRSIFQIPKRAAQDKTIRSGLTVETLKDVGNKILDGDIQTLRTVNDAIRLVAGHEPQSAELVRATVGRALRGSIEEQYVNRPIDLVEKLAAMGKKEDVSPYLRLAGFDPDKAAALLPAVKKYSKADLSPDIIKNALESQDVALGLARGVMERQLRDSAAYAAIGQKQKSIDLLKRADKAAKDAGIAEQDARTLYSQVSANPLLAAFSGKGGYSLSKEGGVVGEGSISHLIMSLGPDAGARMMGELRRVNPELATLVSRKVIADELYRITGVQRNAKEATSKIDVAALRKFYKPEVPQDIERLEQIKRIAGSAMTGRVQTFFSNLEKVYDKLQEGQFMRGSQSEAAATAAGLAGVLIKIPGLSALGAYALVRRIDRLFFKKKYDILSYFATDPSFVAAAANTKKWHEIMSSMPVRRAYLYTQHRGLADDMASDDLEP